MRSRLRLVDGALNGVPGGGGEGGGEGEGGGGEGELTSESWARQSAQNDVGLLYGLVTFIIVAMPFHNRPTQYIMGYNIMAQPHGLTMSL